MYAGGPTNPDLIPDRQGIIDGWGEEGPPMHTTDWQVPPTPPGRQVYQPAIGYCFGPGSLLAPDRLSIVEINGRHYDEPKTYRSITHAYCANKAARKDDHDRIARAETPELARITARTVDRWPDWELSCYTVMEVLIRSRLERDDAFRMALIAAGRTRLVLDQTDPTKWSMRDRDGDFTNPNVYGRWLKKCRPS